MAYHIKKKKKKKKKRKVSDAINQSCSNCENYIDGKTVSCEEADNVIESYGKDNLDRWLGNPNIDNNCGFWEPLPDVNDTEDLFKKIVKDKEGKQADILRRLCNEN